MAVNIDGDGLIALGGTASTQGRLRLAEDTDNGTNFVALQAPASIAADVTFTLPAADGTANQVLKTDGSGNLGFATPSAGKVLQVVSTVKTNTFSTSSGSFVDITGVSVAITPTIASSKIMVFALLYIGGPAGSTGQAMTRLMRDSTAIAVGDAAGTRTQAGSEVSLDSTFGMQPAVHTFLDSPATTSAVTYKVQMRVTAGTFKVNATGGDVDTSTESRVVSTITVMEIAA